MANQLARVIAPDGATFHVEIRTIDGGDDLTPVSFIDDSIEQATDLANKLNEIVKGCSEVFLEGIQNAGTALRLSKASISFGVQIGAEGGVPFVTKGTANANFGVTIEWELHSENKSSKGDEEGSRKSND